ncbi:uncharacterized protein [Chiloscyllium punctatum]|uniref:uncharacterized protein n=1 Tax=Chiloscyllium punctatum TaxID=137246 RepID=UPI003B634050
MLDNPECVSRPVEDSDMATEGSPPVSAGSPHVSDANPPQCTRPDPLKRFRNCEPKALSVALLMLGLIVFALEVRYINAVPSKVIQSGSPFLVAVLFVVTGTLVLLGDQKPRQILLKACLVCAIVTMVTSAIELVMYLVDISEHRKMSLLCLVGEDTQRCYHLLGKQRLLYVNVPIFYLLTLSGMMLCIIVSISLYHLLRLWEPQMDQLLRSSSPPPSRDPEGATLISPEPEQEDAEPTADRGTGDRETPKSRAGKRTLLVHKFLEGQPKVLGVIHVVLGLTIPLLTLETLSTNPWEMVKVGFNAWLTVQCVATGTVSILAENRPTVNMVRPLPNDGYGVGTPSPRVRRGNAVTTGKERERRAHRYRVGTPSPQVRSGNAERTGTERERRARGYGVGTPSPWVRSGNAEPTGTEWERRAHRYGVGTPSPQVRSGNAEPVGTEWERRAHRYGVGTLSPQVRSGNAEPTGTEWER